MRPRRDIVKWGAAPDKTVKSKQEIMESLRRARPELERKYGITRLALFGSHARGEATEASDVDILVDFDPRLGLRFVDLAEQIEALVGVRTDVISRRAIPARRWAEIERELEDVA